MLSLSVDGLSLNWRIVELLQEEHREQCGGAQLQIIGSCGLHTMHNLFKNGFAVWQVEKAEHFLFHCAPARREDFLLVTKCDTLPLPFCGHRWPKTCRQWREPLKSGHILSPVWIRSKPRSSPIQGHHHMTPSQKPGWIPLSWQSCTSSCVSQEVFSHFSPSSRQIPR